MTNSQDNCYLAQGNYCGMTVLPYNIKKGDRVLDIGSGSHPFWLATHLLDINNKEYENQRYEHHLATYENQEFIDGTTEMLKTMKDKEWDFIRCNHLLEHIENLPEILNEISRVGKRGYVAVPHYIYDFYGVNSKQGHKWFCDYKDNTLLIRKRLSVDFNDEFAGYFSQFIWNKGFAHQRACNLWEAHKGEFGLRWLWEIRFFWTDRIDFKIDETIFPQIDILRKYIQFSKN